MRKLAIFLLVNCITLTVFAQNKSAKAVYYQLRQNNQSFLNLKDSIILIEYVSKNRYKIDSNNLNPHLYVIKNKLKKTEVYDYTFWNTSIWNGERFQSKHYREDTFVLNNGDYSFDQANKTYPSPYFLLLRELPTVQNEDLSYSKYTKPSISYGDSVILIKQLLKKSSLERTLVLDKSLKIIKVVHCSLDTNALYNYFEVKIHYLNGCKIDSLLSVFQFGDSSKSHSPKNKYIEKDPFNQHSKCLRLINDSLLINKDSKQLYILDYWYLNCGACYLMLPELIKIKQQLDSAKVQIIGVNIYDKPSEIVMFQRMKSFEMLQYDCRTQEPPIKVNAYPTLILVDSGFNELKRWEGYSPYNFREFVRYLKELDLLKKEN